MGKKNRFLKNGEMVEQSETVVEQFLGFICKYLMP